MKRLIAGITAGLVLSLPLSAEASIPTDKAAHFGVSYVICDQQQTAQGYYVCRLNFEGGNRK